MHRLTAVFAAAILLSSAAHGQRKGLKTINTSTPEGQALQQIGAEQDDARKIELMEKFMAANAGHEGAPWVLSQMQASYTNTGDFDKAMAAGDKLLAADPADFDAAYANLKAAEKKNDPDAVLKYAAATSAGARKSAGGTKPADIDEDEWKRSVDFAKQIDTYSEYALFATAAKSSDPAKIMALGDGLEKINPQSQYLSQMLPKYAAAGRQANKAAEAAQFGERAYARKQVNDEMLLLMAEQAMNQQQWAKTETYGTQAAELAQAQTKPDGVSDADWQKRTAATVGAARWMQGIALSSQQKYAEADKVLRGALPLIKDNEYLMGGATFHLGLANYQMGRASKNTKQIKEALQFSQQSAALKSPFQPHAQKNVKAIQAEYRIR